jgi:hypothetical protein
MSTRITSVGQDNNINATFTISFEQFGEKRNIFNDVVVLKKDSFDIIFEFPNRMGVLINASFDFRTFKLASEKVHLDKLPGFSETGMAEGLLNSDKEIFISASAPNYWFYDNDEFNRFNKVEKKDTAIICKRTIQNFFNRDNNLNILVTDIDRPLYLVIVSYKDGDDRTNRIELQRQLVKIDWEK